MSIQGADTARHVEVDATDLPLYCPTAAAPLWARHPRVFLDVAKAWPSAGPWRTIATPRGGGR